MSGSLNYKPNVAAVVLAAGASVRMSGIKQLLPWKSTSLLGHVLDQLKTTAASRIYVVVGAHREEILAGTDLTGISLIDNPNWEQGMGSSISETIKHLEEENVGYEGLLLAVCDQPMLSVNHYKKLINSCIDPDRIIASYYDNRFGVPVVFGSTYFEELKSLKEDRGARSVINAHLKNLVRLDAPMGGVDLDTKEIYERYFSSHGH